MLRVFAKAKSKPGCADQLRPILQRLVKASQSEAGVLTYELFETKEQGEFLFREEYSGSEQFEAHRRSRHVQVAVARAAPLMEGTLALWIVEPVSSGESPAG
jgi:quinol monooxygenase YgiN